MWPPESRFHNECVGAHPFCRFGGFSAAQFEVAGVKQRFVFGPEKNLCGTKDVPGRQEHKIDIVHPPLFAKRQNVFLSLSRKTRLH